jgi:hypothetical protein
MCTFMVHIPVRHPAVVQIGFPTDLSHAVSGWCLHHQTLG